MNDSRDVSALRTHRCGGVNGSMVDQPVRLAGWAAKIRDMGGVVFIDLRDRWGFVQVVCESEEMVAAAHEIKLESVVAVSGRDYGNDVQAWRQYAQTGKSDAPEVSVAERVRRSLF